MIVKNEADVLKRCLESVRGIADEIIIVDTGSTDSTKAIAKEYTDKVYDYVWIDDFSAARNYAFSLSSKDYVMWLDADDVIDPVSREKIIRFKRADFGGADFIYLKYDVSFDAGGNPVFSYFRERIIRNCELARFSDPVHEAIVPFGKAFYLDASVSHKKLKSADSGRNLKIYRAYIKNGNVLSPRMKYYYARELMSSGKYTAACRQFKDFIADADGWIENKISACRDLYRCKKLLPRPARDVSVLFKSFEYAPPRAEILCEIGFHYFETGLYQTAAYWYSLALESKPEKNSLAFTESDSYGYIPLLQLCVIYDRLGEREKAYEYNLKAWKLKPGSEECRANAEYFRSVLKR